MAKRQSNFSSRVTKSVGTDDYAGGGVSKWSSRIDSTPSVSLPAIEIPAVLPPQKSPDQPAAKRKKSNFERERSGSNIVGFERRRRIVREVGREGEERLLLILPSEAGGETSADLSFLLDFPNLVDPVSDALLTSAEEQNNLAVTVINKTRSLHGAGKFFGYLRENGRFHFALCDLTTQEVNAFVAWIDQLKGWKDISKHTSFFAMRRVFSWLQASPRWSAHFHPTMQFPMNPWRGVQRDSIGQAELIPKDDLSSIYQACYQEAHETMKRVKEWRVGMEVAAASGHPSIITLDKSSSSLQSKRINNPYMDINVLLATLRHHNLHLPLPSSDGLKVISPALATAVAKNGGRYLLGECFYPSFRALAPFVLLMAIHLYYNQSTLLGSKVDDYTIKKNVFDREEFHAGLENMVDDEHAEKSDGDLLFADPVKNRAKGTRQLQVRPVTDDPDNPATIWKFLVEWTESIRPLALQNHRNNLFLAFTSGTGPEARASVKAFWCNSKQHPGGAQWKKALQSFYKDHDLTYHTFKKFRTTGLDMVEMLYGGDVRKKAAAGGHATVDVTYQSYRTVGQMMRGDEALAWVGLWRQRWRESQEKIDPRSMPNSADIGAATPGWKCVDPFSGPFVTGDGKACAGYGNCPSCPHAGIDENDSYACAQVFNLLDAIDRAAEEIDPAAWHSRWSPVRARLVNGWIPLFPESILNAARKIDLPRMPPLE